MLGLRRLTAILLLVLIGVGLAKSWPAWWRHRPNAVFPAGTVVVCYFHSGTHCESCDKIERLRHQAIQQAFPEQLRDGRLVWRDINYEEPENAQQVKEFQVLTACIVLVDTRRGGAPKFKNLWRELWALVQRDDTQGFVTLVQNETRAMLGEKIK